VYVPVRVPDLTIDEIVLPERIAAGQAITVGVVISSVGQGVVSDTFDVDLYVNPRHTPILPGQPGQTTAEGSSPKQWYSQPLPVGESDELSYVVVPPRAGEYELWAQVDTSGQVFELDEENNILGPIEFTLFCSEQCDDFEPGPPDPKWTLTAIGAGAGQASQSITQEGALQISGAGSDVQRADDGRSHILHQGAHGDNWEMTVKVLNYPRGGQEPMAGLMVRASDAVGAPYAAIAIGQHGGGPALQVLARETAGAVPSSPCGVLPVPGYLFDGSESNGEGVYLRITREGQTFTVGASTDGASWQSESCMQHTWADPVDTVLPGIWFAPTSSSQAQYDRFRLCPLGESGPPDVRPKPPLLTECGNVLLNSDLEPAGELSPWDHGDTPQAVTSSADYSADPNGQLVEGHSMQMQLDLACPGGTCQAWAEQAFILPTFISTTQPVQVEIKASLYSLVPPPVPESTGRDEDELRLIIRNEAGADLIESVVVTNGGQAERSVFHRFEQDLTPLFGSDVQDYVGETLRFRLAADNRDGQGSSRFHLDQIRCDVCTTIQAPEPEPDKVYRVGGQVVVILDGRPTRLSGIEVWAIQLPDGVTPPEELGSWSTYTIQDSTYNLFNLNPGRYRIYAEAWVSGNLYTAATTVRLEAGQTILDVNLILL
jgi:hypothetical protein